MPGWNKPLTVFPLPREQTSRSPGRTIQAGLVPGDHVDMHVTDGPVRGASGVEPGVIISFIIV